MFKILTKNKKGFTLVELIVVLLLLSFGVLALSNMFKVTYRAFQKSEERSIKQEAVKVVAEMLRKGSTNVASSMSADIFDTTEVLPTVEADISYSYLYFEPHAACSECGSSWDFDKGHCSKITKEEEVYDEETQKTNKVVEYCSSSEREPIDGYFIKCMNKGVKKAGVKPLVDVPIYITIEPIKDFPVGATDAQKQNPANMVNQCGVIIKLSALESDFKYEEIDEDGKVPQGNINNPVLNDVISDNIYYSLDVAYHFPNMVLSESGITVNRSAEKKISAANTYNSNGEQSGTVEAVDKGGVVLRVYSDAIISGDTSNTNLSTPPLCFIATASYGLESGEVGLLCDFRDKCLLTNPLGTAFVKAYYKLSPPVADFIAESEPLKAAVRVALKPLVAVATNALDEDAARQNAPWFIVFMLCGAGVTATLIKVDRRNKKTN